MKQFCQQNSQIRCDFICILTQNLQCLNCITIMESQISITKQAFKTQISQPSHLTQTKKQFTKYMESISSKISNAIKAQNSTITVKRQQMKQQVCLIEERKQRQSYKMRKMQQYFVKYCEAVLKQDIEKWARNDQFFKQLFKMYDKRIKNIQQQNAVFKERIKHLSQDLKCQMKQVRKMQLSTNKKVQHNKIVQLQMIKQQIESHRRQKSQQRDSIVCKSFTKDTRVKTEISLPSLALNPQNKESRCLNNSVRFKRATKQISLLQKTQHLVTQPNEPSKVYKYNSESNQKLGYMMPIRTVKEKYQSPLAQLEKLLDWYKQDQQKQLSQQQKWFNTILFNERNYKKLKSYLKDNAKNRFRRIITQR